MKKSKKNRIPASPGLCRCKMSCLGPLTFHPLAVGTQTCLSYGARYAERNEHTFKNGLVFSSRPVKVEERICVKVQKTFPNWNGAMRVGFTNVPPSARSLPLPSLAIPDLTSSSGHWAAPIEESYCLLGSELEFWVSARGNFYCANSYVKHKLLSGLDLSQPMWAIIDIYGRTGAISILRSVKKGPFGTRKSCPAPEEYLTPKNGSCSDISRLCKSRSDCITMLSKHDLNDLVCVVCMTKEARVELPCGHQCLCNDCCARYIVEFDSCPLCRKDIKPRKRSA